MTVRMLLVGAAALLLLAAAPVSKNKPAPTISLERPAANIALPTPPTPPDTTTQAGGFHPAPVPNQDLERPAADLEAAKPHTELVPRLYNKPDRRPGDGYVPGSAAQYDPDRKMRPSPTLSLKVPIQ